MVVHKPSSRRKLEIKANKNNVLKKTNLKIVIIQKEKEEKKGTQLKQ